MAAAVCLSPNAGECHVTLPPYYRLSKTGAENEDWDKYEFLNRI